MHSPIRDKPAALSLAALAAGALAGLAIADAGGHVPDTSADTMLALAGLVTLSLAALVTMLVRRAVLTWQRVSGIRASAGDTEHALRAPERSAPALAASGRTLGRGHAERPTLPPPGTCSGEV